MTQIAILDDYQNVAKSIVDWDRLPKNASLMVFNGHVFDQKILVDRLKNFEIICSTLCEKKASIDERLKNFEKKDNS